ncbi:MAG: hypothetical protein CSB13_01720 [Chloroflexi bacterium]|nr:MAG: hypothetical protein CSB13_01720 [Chloroflexota bacterium]
MRLIGLLRTYEERGGVRVRLHQLRHSCATLLLNAGEPLLAVQAILGHKNLDTTLMYARLYDGTVAAGLSRATAANGVAGGECGFVGAVSGLALCQQCGAY